MLESSLKFLQTRGKQQYFISTLLNVYFADIKFIIFFFLYKLTSKPTVDLRGLTI